MVQPARTNSQVPPAVLKPNRKLHNVISAISKDGTVTAGTSLLTNLFGQYWLRTKPQQYKETRIHTHIIHTIIITHTHTHILSYAYTRKIKMCGGVRYETSLSSYLSVLLSPQRRRRRLLHRTSFCRIYLITNPQQTQYQKQTNEKRP